MTTCDVTIPSILSSRSVVVVAVWFTNRRISRRDSKGCYRTTSARNSTGSVTSTVTITVRCYVVAGLDTREGTEGIEEVRHVRGTVYRHLTASRGLCTTTGVGVLSVSRSEVSTISG